MEQRNMAQVRRAVEEVWNAGDLAVADLLFAPTYVNHGGLIPDLVCGPEAIKSAVALYRAAFPGLYIVVEGLTAEQEIVEMSWAAHRIRPTALAAHSATEGAEALRGTTRSRHAGGQIKESWTDWDSVGALRQLGIVGAAPRP